MVRESNGGMMYFAHLLEQIRVSRVQRSYERSELEKAGRFPAFTKTNTSQTVGSRN